MGRVMPEDAKKPSPPWDDEKFIATVRELAEARAMSMAELARQSGLGEEYFVKRRQGRGRNLNSIIHLAGVLGVPVSELVDPPANLPSARNGVDPVKLERLATVATVAAHLYLALDSRRATLPEDVDPEELLQLLMRIIEPRGRPRTRS